MSLLISLFDSLFTYLNLENTLTAALTYDLLFLITQDDTTLIFIFKVALCIGCLILIRGGVPRYRYDFLTKIGWVKFLGYILTIFLLTILVFIVW